MRQSIALELAGVGVWLVRARFDVLAKVYFVAVGPLIAVLASQR
jgi:energy-converting hydrogenase Eha subunit E